MPKRVDHDERRRQIAEALLRVVSRTGLEAASLRNVATEAGVTSGMVQHYFPSKDAMIDFAMDTATTRYERRITARLEQLGDGPDPRRIVRTLLTGLLPADDVEAQDAKVALAFQAYAADRPAAAARLEQGNAQLRGHLAEVVASANPGVPDPQAAATALLATAEGLAVHMISSRLPHRTALHALDHAVELVLDPKAGG